LSRFRILALFATSIALASVFAACGGGSDDGGNSGEDAQQLVEDATLEGVKSGELDLSLHVTSEGKEGGEIDVSLSGPFEAGVKDELPRVELSAEAKGTAGGEDIDFDGGLTLLTDRAFVDYEGTTYEVDPTSFSFLKGAFEQAQQRGGEEEDLTACQKAAEGIEFSQLADNLKNDGEADVEGTSTTKVSGDLDVSGAIDAVIDLTEDPACSAQLEAAGPLPLDELEKAKDELSQSIEKTHVDLYVGDDDIVRKVAAELTIAPPDAGREKVEMELELTLSGVNEEQSISSPANAKPLQGLFDKLGIDPLELLEEGSEGDLSGLLESLSDAIGGSSSSAGDSSGGSSRNDYRECLREAAKTATDLQQCANLLN
jgi:hypothetical protein